MTHFVRAGNSYMVSPTAAMNITDTLPVGNYAVKFNPQNETFYLDEIEAFALPKKIYGTANNRAVRILRTFFDRSGSTGVLLTGEKGSGKTLLSKQLSVGAAKEGVPTIVVNQPFFGDVFNTFIQSIEQPAIVLFDEFEKVYDREKQERVLTLLDGVFPSHKLFVLTVNDKWRVDSHMRNRPGRLFYNIEYKGLEQDFVREYCEDVLEDKSKVEDVMLVALLFAQFNFDMLKALVEEMNRYDETAHEAMALLNAKPEYSDDARYEVELLMDKVRQPTAAYWTGNPLLAEDLQFGWRGVEDKQYYAAIFDNEDLAQVEQRTGTFTFVKDNYQLILKKAKTAEVNYSKFAV